jgi:hypothetical protein
MANFFEIPLESKPQSFKISLGGTDYWLRLTYQKATEGGWVLDISDANHVAIVNGIPLVTGCNLLEQYKHLGFAGRLWVQTASDPDAVPTFNNLGNDAYLYWVTD